ncbi:hypothetical protein LCGC14_2269020 [marine sediment metagenome]|uniref:Uncharacterized protein n=1 Tax=marine sediment metagenome TaxID=412755 RepID=A0A0F9DJQ5_9ZZZZ
MSKVSVQRPTGHITDLLRRLTLWRDRRTGINVRPGRKGKALPNRELNEAIAYLEEYRELVTRGDS